jgi:alanine racemase
MGSLNSNRPTWAEINLPNLADNYKAVKNFVGGQVKVMAVVKADGYGHGAVECARKLAAENADWFGVSLPEEAFELRANGIDKTPILVLGGFWPGQESKLLQDKITPVVYRLEMAELFNRAAFERNEIADIHIKVDTGMGRLGVRFDEIAEFAEALRQFPNLRMDGLMTHFAVADDFEENSFTENQILKFNESIKIFQEKGFKPTIFDLANSPGTLAHLNAHGNLVRIGGVLYGLWRDVLPKAERPNVPLKPVMSLHTKIAHLKKVPKGETLGYGRTFKTKRDSIIATLPIGYHDGLPRCLSNKWQVMIKQQLVPIVGRVSMDLTLVEVTDLPNVRVFEEVMLFGKKNDVEIPVENLAKVCNTISYEITCGISERVPKIFVE